MYKYCTFDSGRFYGGVAYITGFNMTTVRIKLTTGEDAALCTFTYSQGMSLQLRQMMAERAVACWNANNN